MTDSESEDDGSEQGSLHEDESEEGEEDVVEVQTVGSRASVKPILRFPERNDTDDTWTRPDGTGTVTSKNKYKTEDMTRVGQRFPQ